MQHDRPTRSRSRTLLDAGAAILVLGSAILALACGIPPQDGAASNATPGRTQVTISSFEVADGSLGTALRCSGCPLLDVIGIPEPGAVSTDQGVVWMRGAYLYGLPSDCQPQIENRFAGLVGSSLRFEWLDQQVSRDGRKLGYLFTVEGDSVEEILLREGLARASDRDSPHLGWFLYREDTARENEAGCLWEGWQAFKAGEPNSGFKFR